MKITRERFNPGMKKTMRHGRIQQGTDHPAM